jgi:hypothetical protein
MENLPHEPEEKGEPHGLRGHQVHGHRDHRDRDPGVPGGVRPTAGERLIDCEEDRTLRAVLVGRLREDERNA